MKVAYVFGTSGHTASYKLGQMILPQREKNAGSFGFRARKRDEQRQKYRCLFSVRVLPRGMEASLAGELRNNREEAPVLALDCWAYNGARKNRMNQNTHGAEVVGMMFAALASNPPDHIITL